MSSPDEIHAPRGACQTTSKQTVYLLGAGVNKCLPDAPLIREVFKVGMRRKIRPGKREAWARTMAPIFEFIETYWHIGATELADREVDLEEVLTFIELLHMRLERERRLDELARLREISRMLNIFLYSVFEWIPYWMPMPLPLEKLGRRILSEGATVLTFNYDYVIEAAIERASDVNHHVPPEVLELSTDPSLEKTPDVALPGDVPSLVELQ